MSIYDKASLVLIPSGTKTSKVYSQKPVNGDGDFTFSRSTAATRVNADGNIEKETQNLLLQSNSFDTTWGSTRTNEVSGYSGYDGTSDAWKIIGTDGADGVRDHYLRQSYSVTGVVTFSAYFKAAEKNWVRVLFANSPNPRADFDLNNGSVHNIAGDAIDAEIISVGNDWYRCSLTANLTASSIIQIYVAEGSGVTAWTGDDTSGVYIQDAQLEQGLVARDYIETTTAAVEGGITDNVPRLDYTDSSCPALLLEPQRRNILPHSEYFGLYNALNGSSVTSNYSVSPEGVTNATRVLLSAQNLSRVELAVNAGVTIESKSQTISCWVKSNGADTDFRLKCTHSSVLDYYSSNLTATSEWQRFTFTQLFGAGSSTTITAGILNSTANNAADLSIYGMQLEVNSSYATSYIPTYGTSVTRDGEVSTGAGNATTFNDSEGVLFVDTTILSDDSDSKRLTISDGTFANRITLSISGNIVSGFINVNNVTQYTFFESGQDVVNPIKIAVKYKANDFAIWINGVEYDASTSGTTFPSTTLIQLSFDNASGGNVFASKTKQVLYFPKALSDAELADLTTL